MPTDVNATPPQSPSNGDDPVMKDAAPGGLFPMPTPPASRSQFIGTVAGNAQRKPYTVK